MGKLEEGSPLLGQNLNKPLRPEEYPSPEEIESLTGKSEISRRKLLYFGLVVGVPALVAACSEIQETPAVVRTPEEVGLPPTPTLEPPPTFEPTIAPEPTPKPTVVVETMGFGGLEELTMAEQTAVNAIRGAYENAAREQDLVGAVVLTRGDEEGEIGAFFRDGQENPWSLVTRTVEGAEKEILEPVPFYNGVVAEWKPNEMRFEYLVDGETLVFEPENRILINGEGKVISEWNMETSSWEEVVPEPTPVPEPAEPVEMVAVGNVDLYLSPGEDMVGYFVPGQRFTPTGTVENGWVQVIDSNNNTLWIQEGGAYEQYIEEAACQVLHFQNRTSARRSGVIEMRRGPIQEIFPEVPYEMRWIDIGNNEWVSRRDARVVTVDRENSIASFLLSDGSVIRRKFTPNAIVIMEAWDWRSAMPVEQAFQRGGNICDLEEGDAVSLLHPDESQSAAPNPNLVDSWGILFVQ